MTFLCHIPFLQLFIPVSQQLSPAAMGDVYATLIAVITTMTVETTVMRWDACSELVTPRQNLLAIMEGVSLFITSAMVQTTVTIMALQMREIAVSWLKLRIVPDSLHNQKSKGKRTCCFTEAVWFIWISVYRDPENELDVLSLCMAYEQFSHQCVRIVVSNNKDWITEENFRVLFDNYPQVIPLTLTKKRSHDKQIWSLSPSCVGSGEENHSHIVLGDNNEQHHYSSGCLQTRGPPLAVSLLDPGRRTFISAIPFNTIQCQIYWMDRAPVLGAEGDNAFPRPPSIKQIRWSIKWGQKEIIEMDS